MTSRKQICFAVLLSVTLLLMVMIISAEFSFSFSFSADSRKIKLGQQKFFPNVTEEDGAREYPEFEMPVVSDTYPGVFGREDSWPEEDPAERKLMRDQKEFRLMADWLIEQQRLHGGLIRDFLPEHLKYLAPDPNQHESATTEPAPTTQLATTPPVTSSPTPSPSPIPSMHKSVEEIKKLEKATPKPSEVATVAEEEEVVSTTPATPELETHKLEDHDIQVTEEMTAKPVGVPDLEIIEEVDEPITSEPEAQDSKGFSGGVVQDASPGDDVLGYMSPEERTGVEISRGDDQIQPEADVNKAVDYSLDSEAEEVSLQHQVKTGVQISRSGVNSQIQQQAEVQDEVPVEIQGNTEVDSPVGMVTIGETGESAEPLKNEADSATTPQIPPTPTPPTTPEPDTSPKPTEEESSTMGDST